MSIGDLLWGLVLVGMTVAYGMTFLGVRAAKRNDVNSHRRWMTLACALVGIWLLAYVSKQMILGRDHFGGTPDQYWIIYIPLLLVHTWLAITTLGGTNMVMGIRRLRYGIGAGSMVAGVSTHRKLGHLLQWTFGGTILTAYAVYLMLFVWFPAG